MDGTGFEMRVVGVIAQVFAALAFLPAMLTSVQADIPQTGCYKRETLDPKVEAAIEEFRASVPVQARATTGSGSQTQSFRVWGPGCPYWHAACSRI